MKSLLNATYQPSARILHPALHGPRPTLWDTKGPTKNQTNKMKGLTPFQMSVVDVKAGHLEVTGDVRKHVFSIFTACSWESFSETEGDMFVVLDPMGLVRGWYRGCLSKQEEGGRIRAFLSFTAPVPSDFVVCHHLKHPPPPPPGRAANTEGLGWGLRIAISENFQLMPMEPHSENHSPTASFQEDTGCQPGKAPWFLLLHLLGYHFSYFLPTG